VQINLAFIFAPKLFLHEYYSMSIVKSTRVNQRFFSFRVKQNLLFTASNEID